MTSEVSGKHHARESFIAGQLQNKIISPYYFNNAIFYESENTKKLIENAGCQILFLPSYSPDLNPIEKFWTNLKAKIKKVIGKFQILVDAIDLTFINYHLFFN